MGRGCIQVVFRMSFLLEDGIGDDKLLFHAKLKQQAPIFVAVSDAVSTKNSFPGNCVLAHSGVKVPKDYYFVVCRGALEEAAKLGIELVLVRRFSLKSWGIHCRA